MVYMLVLARSYFGRYDYDWQSIDVTRASDVVRSSGIPVTVASLEDFDRNVLRPEDIVWYSSQDNPVVHEFVRDVMYFIGKRCTILPRYELLLAFENKGVQTLVKEDLGIAGLWEKYVYRAADLPKQGPFVLKTVRGAASSGVFLVESGISRRLRRRLFQTSLRDSIKRILRHHRLSGADWRHYSVFKGPVGLAVAQQFASGLGGDSKVLVFGTKYYVLSREVRPNDFRASGSGRFGYRRADPSLLNFARNLFLALDTPYVSLDIAKAGEEYVLFELQATNFGPITLRRSPGWYEQDAAGEWRYLEGRSDVAEEMGRALVNYIERKGLRSEGLRELQQTGLSV